MRLVHTLTLLGLGLVARAQSTTYVRAGGTGDGSSWTAAAGDLAAVLDAAAAGDEVWVAAGTYAPATCVPCTLADRAATFRLHPGVRVRGGFAGSESALVERTGAAGATVLAGRIGTGADTTACLTIMTAVSPTAGTLLEGLSFVGGRADAPGGGLADPGVSGGQLDVIIPQRGDSAALTIRRCRFEGAYAKGFGAALFVDAKGGRHARLSLEGCDFADNYSRTGGAGAYVGADDGGAAEVSVVGGGFRQNRSELEGGAGLYLSSRNGGHVAASLTDVDFGDNDAGNGNGGALRLLAIGGEAALAVTRARFERNCGFFGGAVEADVRFGGRAAVRFSNVAFRRNHSRNGGGAFYLDANAGGASDPVFEDCAFLANRSEESGGALYFNGFEGATRPRLERVRIEGNTAALYGGAIYNFGRGGVASPRLTNVLIARNRASSAGGIYCLGSGGGDSSPRITHCAFVNNVAEVGGALYSNAGDTTGRAAPFVLNTIFQGNRAPTGRTLRNILGRPLLAYNSFDADSCAALRSGTGEQHACTLGNQFGNADVFADTARRDYRLRADAPVIDAAAVESLGDTLPDVEALPDSDALGRARRIGRGPDLGPLEFAPDAPDSLALTGGSACLGAALDVALAPLPYPIAARWARGGQIVAEGPALRIPAADTADARAYVLITDGWTGVDTQRVTLSVRARTQTALATDGPAPSDTLLAGGRYLLRAVASPTDAVATVRWTSREAGVDVAADTVVFSPPDTGRYRFLVEVAYAGECLDTTSRSAVLGFDVSRLPSGIAQPLAAGGYRLLGNPVGDFLRIGGLSAKPAMATLYAQEGRIVARGRIADDRPLAVGDLAPGVYLLRLDAHDGTYAAPVVKR